MLCLTFTDKKGMPMILHEKSHTVRHGRMSASLVSVTCFLRGLPLFFCATPKTPLRVLCLIAFNTLHVLRKSKPLPRFDEVCSYRETVVRLSLGIVAAIALGDECVEDGIRATHRDNDLETLFRIVMQCQIIDDVLDYAKDVSAGLPSFLTASASLPQAMELTAQAARSYATCRDLPQSAGVFPLRFALCVVSAFTKLVIGIGHWQHGSLNWETFAAIRRRPTRRVPG